MFFSSIEKEEKEEKVEKEEKPEPEPEVKVEEPEEKEEKTVKAAKAKKEKKAVEEGFELWNELEVQRVKFMVSSSLLQYIVFHLYCKPQHGATV